MSLTISSKSYDLIVRRGKYSKNDGQRQQMLRLPSVSVEFWEHAVGTVSRPEKLPVWTKMYKLEVIAVLNT